MARRSRGKIPATLPSKRQILLRLCRGNHTVSELAAELHVTDNAVRAQLHRLQREGLVRASGVRPGVRRPHAEYELTDAARTTFPRAYGPVVRAMVGVLASQLSEAQRTAVLTETARRVLAEHVGQLEGQQPRQRLESAVKKLGGPVAGIDLIDDAGRLVVRSCSCPLAELTAGHPEICGILTSVLSEIVGADVHERCERTGAPRCGFEIADA